MNGWVGAWLVAGLLFSGTEGLRAQNFSGDLTVPQRVPGKVRRRVPGSARPGPAAGRGSEGRIKVSDLTRKDAVKDVLRELLRAYVQQDIFAFFKRLAPEALQGVGIMRQAVQNDFQTETNLNVDVELNEYRQEMGSICLRFRWNRMATRIDTGVPSVQTGNCQFCFDREEDFRVSRIIGVPPFGLSDAQFLEQVRAGQPQTTALSLRTLSLGSDSAFIDFDTGRVTPLGPGAGASTYPGGTDVAWVKSFYSEGAYLSQAAGTAQHGAEPADPSAPTQVTAPGLDGAYQMGGGETYYFLSFPLGIQSTPCTHFGESSGGDPSTFVRIDESTFVYWSHGVRVSLQSGQRRTVGLRTDQGRYVIAEFEAPGTVRYQISDDAEFNAGASKECGHQPE